ncbi:MAG: D-glycero-beta-D-manno-heptose-7-phosphate kinase [Alphaproteobacteria bacterium]|nr:D-glycero-beta-D-manno-heptose-7-phosphate kinase [Alphaproteobacteria bacterium]
MLAHLQPHLEKIKGHHVLCVGDMMLDRFFYGHVERISPEAPIPVLRIEREDIALGGSGNVVRNVVSLGGDVDIVGVIGKDQTGYELGEQIAQMRGVTPCLITDDNRRTTIKTRHVADGQQLLRADRETGADISEKIEDQIIMCVKSTIENCDIIILSDYAKGVLTPKVTQAIMQMAAEHNKRVLVDPKGRDFERYRGAFMLTPNRKELGEAVGQKIQTIGDAEDAARILIARYDLQGILAKLGADGVCLVMKEQEALHFRATARAVHDVSGAGDTVVATMALCLAGGVPEEDGAMLANMAGSIAVGKVGTATVSCQDIIKELQRDYSRASEEKILDQTTARETVDRWHKQSLKVGFTNGVFDLLHPGHLSLLRQARAACDRLVVGVNSDSSVKRLKGEDRPVQNEVARATVLAALADVDLVVVFSEDTPFALIESLRPSLLVKGGDYTLDQVVGADLVQSWEGEVLLAEIIEGQSTTAMIKRAKS